MDVGWLLYILLFNLMMMYELCMERVCSLKVRLLEKVVVMEEMNDGWEKINVDFKL